MKCFAISCCTCGEFSWALLIFCETRFCATICCWIQQELLTRKNTEWFILFVSHRRRYNLLGLENQACITRRRFISTDARFSETAKPCSNDVKGRVCLNSKFKLSNFCYTTVRHHRSPKVWIKLQKSFLSLKCCPDCNRYSLEHHPKAVAKLRGEQGC